LQIFLFYPVVVAILQGQDSILLLLGFCLAYRCWRSKPTLLSGILVGLTMFKPQIAIPLAVFLFIRYPSSAFFSGLAVGTGSAVLLSIRVTGWNAVLSFARVLRLTTVATLAPDSQPLLGVAPLAMPNLKGLISGITLNRSPAAVTLLTTAVLSMGIAIAVIRHLRLRRPDPQVAFSMALTASLLLSYYLHLQDLAVLLLPLSFLAGYRSQNFAVASWLLYVAPPFVVMLGHSLIFLLSVPLIFLLLAAFQRGDAPGSPRRRPTVSGAPL